MSLIGPEGYCADCGKVVTLTRHGGFLGYHAPGQSIGVAVVCPGTGKLPGITPVEDPRHAVADEPPTTVCGWCRREIVLRPESHGGGMFSHTRDDLKGALCPGSYHF